MALYLFTLGFHADHIIRRLYGARDVDSIIILTAKPVVRAVINAYHEVVAFCDKARIKTPKLLEIPLENVARSINMIIEEISSANNVVADLSGGMRSIVVLTMTALLIHSARAQTIIYIQAEREDAPELMINLNLISTITTKGISREKIKIIKETIKTPGITITELAQILNKSEKTIRNYLAELKRLELIKIKGPKQSLHPTEWTKIILKYIE